MQVDQLVEKFKQHPFYLKNGAGLIAKRLKCTKEDVYKAKAIVKQDNGLNTELNDKVLGGKLKSRWQSASGEWLESYRFDEQISQVDIESVLLKVTEQLTPVIIPKITESSEYVFNIYLSDQHIGAKVEHSLYSNYFDKHVYRSRMNKVLFEIIAKSQLYGKFKQINIFYLGDTFDGQDGFTVKRTHPLPQNMSNEECFETGLKVNLEFLNTLFTSEAAQTYTLNFVAQSNHGGSMDYYLFKSIESIVNTLYPQVKVTIANKFIGKFICGVHTFLYCHGKDNIDMKVPLPLNLDKSTENFIAQFIDYNIIVGEVHFIKGDLHQNATVYGKKFRYRNVGSLFGSSTWIMANYGYVEPSVAYDVFTEDKKGITEGIIYFY